MKTIKNRKDLTFQVEASPCAGVLKGRKKKKIFMVCSTFQPAPLGVLPARNATLSTPNGQAERLTAANDAKPNEHGCHLEPKPTAGRLSVRDPLRANHSPGRFLTTRMVRNDNQ